MKTYVYLYYYPGELYSQVELFETKVVQEIKTCFVFSIFFFENDVIYEIVWENYGTVAQATNDNMVHLHCILDA